MSICKFSNFFSRTVDLQNRKAAGILYSLTAVPKGKIKDKYF